MDKKTARNISRERFMGWADRFAEEHATPLLSIGVGHGPKSGNIVVCIPDEDEVTRETIRALLHKALELIG